MSLILDALKKIEQDKRRAADGGAREVVAVSGSRFRGRQNWLSMGAMAVGSALLTAAVVSFLNSPRAETPAAADTSAAATAEDVDVAERETVEPASAPQVALPQAEPVRQSAPAPEPTANDALTRATAPVVDDAAAPTAVETVGEEPISQGDDPVTAGTDEFGESAEEVNAGSQPIRLVGQERILLDALNVREPADTGEATADESLPPADFPELVLQGTSVIGGNAVAVISDRRVFEGDRIEGAVVVRIGEREVELEVDGKRFMLRL